MVQSGNEVWRRGHSRVLSDDDDDQAMEVGCGNGYFPKPMFLFLGFAY